MIWLFLLLNKLTQNLMAYSNYVIMLIEASGSALDLECRDGLTLLSDVRASLRMTWLEGWWLLDGWELELFEGLFLHMSRAWPSMIYRRGVMTGVLHIKLLSVAALDFLRDSSGLQTQVF